MGVKQSIPSRHLRRAATALAGTAGATMVFGAGVALAAPGSLNTEFARTGSLVQQFGLGSSPTSQGAGVAVAANGDIYQVGSATSPSTGDELYIARYLPDGTPDTAFGIGGVAYENVAGPSGSTALPGGVPFGTAEYIALTPSGDPVVLTDASTAAGPELAVVEFTQSGQLNTSFATNGVYQVNVGGKDSTPSGIAVTSDGAIVFTGSFINGSGNEAFFAAQLTSDGGVDSSFGKDGLLEPTLGSGTHSTGEGVIAQSDGDLAFLAFAAGTSTQDMAVLRTNAEGVLDGSFGAGGVAYVPNSKLLPVNPGFAQTAEGGYAIASSETNITTSYPEARVTRLTASGELDSSFGNAGTALLSMPAATVALAEGLFVQADDELIVTGIGAGGPAGATASPFAAVMNADGTPETSFGNAGVSLNPIAGTTGAFTAAAAQTADGNVVLSGWTMTSPGESFLQEVNVDTAPVLVTVADASSVQVGTAVKFAAAAVASDGESLGQVSWDLGSGNFGDATGNTASKTFTAPGTYTVRAKVTDGYGLSTISTQTITVTAAPASATATVTPTSTSTVTPASTSTVTPAAVIAPTLKLVKLTVSHGKVKVTLLCAFAACKVNASLSTHVRKGKTSSLSANGHGKAITVGSTKLSMGVNQKHTFTIKLNKAGRKLLASFKRIPARASFKLTNTKPAKTIHHNVQIR